MAISVRSRRTSLHKSAYVWIKACFCLLAFVCWIKQGLRTFRFVSTGCRCHCAI